jgi:hypothetical protein
MEAKIMVRKKSILIVTILAVALMPVSALAGTTSNGGITLTFPDDMLACNPTFDFSTTGVDPSWEVWYGIFEVEITPDAIVLEQIGGGNTFGDLADVSLAPEPLISGDRQIYAVFVSVLVPGQETRTKLSGKWRVDCDKEPPPGGEGCTPGFWKNHEEVWPIPTGNDFDTTFGVDAFSSDITMFEAARLEGGKLNALGRHATAAYLNALSPVVNFDLTPNEVIAAFQAAVASGDYETTKDMFEAFNELGCPY